MNASSAAVRLTTVAGLCLLPVVPVCADDQVKIRGGTLEGTVGTDPAVRVFKGVPFAVPPVGDLRWKAPQPFPAWTGVRKATTWGTRCMQGTMFGAPLVTRDQRMDEDCLYLNVWTTAKGPNEKRPVLVVFHGGGFAAGSGAEPRTDGEWFAQQGIVVVEPNYRLGLFGFMAHPELSRESGGRGSGNYGMLDQAAALQWVKDNAAAFGGDPGNVTINGESAGSMSVSALMASPLTRELVHKAIGQSGAFFTSPTGGMAQKALPEKEQDGVKFAASIGTATLADLRAKPAADLLAAVMKTGGWGYSPGVDGYFLTENVAATYAAGRQAKIPLLAGWNSSELGMAVAMNPKKPTVASFGEELRKHFGDRPEARDAYPAATDEQAMQSAADLASDLFISYSTWKWIEVHARTAKAPVYRYRFDRVLPEANGSNRFGAAHAVEIEYAFNTLDSKKADWQAEDRRAADVLARAFAHFVKTGNPNGPGVPEWPEFARTHQMLYVDGVSKTGPEQTRARYELIDSVVPAATSALPAAQAPQIAFPGQYALAPAAWRFPVWPSGCRRFVGEEKECLDFVAKDYGRLERYTEANAALAPSSRTETRVVFFGDSITDNWSKAGYGGFFPGKPYVNRGIGGQTTSQMLLRFRADVLALRPRAVVILAGTNDVAGNSGTIRLEDIENNITTMAELAKLHDIRVVLASVLPVSDDKKDVEGRPLLRSGDRPLSAIRALNEWMADYARKNGHVYLDYFSAFADANGVLLSALNDDGLHPNAAGYAVMAPLAEAAITRALAAAR